MYFVPFVCFVVKILLQATDMRRRMLAIAALSIGAVVTLGLCWWHRGGTKPTDIGDLSAYKEQSRHGLPAEPEIERIVYLDQGWSPADSLDFYSRTQGSRLVPYSWFLALEQPDSEELFRANEHVRALGYLPQQPHELNPDGLPVGFVKDPDPDRGDSLGLTCAACHTAEIHYNKTAIRIDGGPTLADIQQLLARLTAAIDRTLADSAKFERFAERLGASNRAELRRELGNAAKLRREFRFPQSHAASVRPGPPRRIRPYRQSGSGRRSRGVGAESGPARRMRP